MGIKKEELTSRRLTVINSQINDIHFDVANFSESLIDREPEKCLEYIAELRVKLNLLREQIIKGEIL